MNSKFYYETAIAASTRGNFNAAISNFDTAIALEPENALYYFERGNVYLATMNHKTAIQDYLRAISINPNYRDVYFNLGYAYTDLHEHRKSIEYFTKALAIVPDHPDTYISRAINYKCLANFEAALNDLKMAEKIAIAQGNFAIINNICDLRETIIDARSSTDQLVTILEKVADEYKQLP